MTRDGTFLIEHGEVTRPVKNLRFTTTISTRSINVRAIGNQSKLFYDDWSHIAQRVPALLVDGFRFTGATQ